MASISFPRQLLVGGGSIKQIPAVLSKLSLQAPFIISDSFLSSSGALRKLIEPLERASVAHRIFTKTVPDPTTESVAETLSALQQGSHDCIIALGGGR